MIYQEHAHRKLRQAFDAILQFSSNGNRKSMLSANRSFQAQNSTCSTLLQTMLLYETCIVLSRKCLWDVNKDFWYQWRGDNSLVIHCQLGPSIGKFLWSNMPRSLWMKQQTKIDVSGRWTLIGGSYALVDTLYAPRRVNKAIRLRHCRTASGGQKHNSY